MPVRIGRPPEIVVIDVVPDRGVSVAVAGETLPAAMPA
ncbi:hypothetical protein A6302_04316 [Methylobrevis pamukkalensis]|uniref:Uncharacterized protein n=1 Tax=Methylobrevis pamukkalensis TaxID=1439726 RepID=A0A1E3GWG4_9HYPH|nr:hypothetical protein A6302_04316 [Methylobrevis pamukkalensis]